MSSHTPYVAHVKSVTARLRARMHSQSFTNTILASTEARRLDVSRVADAQLSELVALRADHRRTCDPLLRQKALSLLQTLPLKPVADDPHLAYTTRALRVCGYFSATQSPATFNFLNHATRHTFLLDAFSIHQLLSALEDMRHPQTAEILSIMLPRVMEVVTDCTEGEARMLLDVYSKHGLLTTDLSERIVDVIIGAVGDMSLKDLSSSVSSVQAMNSEKVARRFLEAATPRLCRALRETTEQVCHYKATYLQPSGLSNTASATTRSTLTGNTTDEQSPIPGAETPTEGTLRRRKEREWRQFLVAQIHDGLSLHRAVQKTITWLCWAPRPLLNEVVRCALHWSEPLLLESVDNSVSLNTAELTNTVASSDTLSSESRLAALSEHQEKFAREIPRVRRRGLCYCLKMLHCTSYRHLPAVRLLSARIAATRDAVDIVSPVVLAHEISQAVEAVAYFYATDCSSSVTVIIDDILEHIKPVMSSPALRGRFPRLSTEELKVAERVVLRVLLSCVRLLAAHAETKTKEGALTTAPVQEGAVHALLCQAIALAISPIIQAYTEVGLRLNDVSKPRIMRDANQLQHLVGTMHLAYAISIILALSVKGGRVEPEPSAAAEREILRANLRRLLPWAQAMATKLSSDLPEEAAVGMSKALAILRKHPEVMDDPKETSVQGVGGTGEKC